MPIPQFLNPYQLISNNAFCLDEWLKTIQLEIADLLRHPVVFIQYLCVVYVIGRFVSPIEDSLLKYGLFKSITMFKKSVSHLIFRWFLGLPVVRTQVKRKVDGILDDLESEIIQRGPEFPEHPTLPSHGLAKHEIDEIVAKLGKLDHSKWQCGRSSGAVYNDNRELRALQTELFGLQTFANQLHPDCFPDVRRMDAEVVSMVLNMYNAPESGCGTTTSGGTESLLLTCLAAREYARAKNPSQCVFEIIAPVTIHAGFDKAAHYFNMKLVHAPLGRDMRVDLNAVEHLIGPNTVLLAGSAPNFPHGVIDDIAGLSDLALKYGVLLHVDACLGSFIVPFLDTVYEKPPVFDFRLPGVTSISCDTHKYGFAPKGSSVIMYRSPSLRRFQYFVSTDWTGGLYASPTLAGSRPGALIAGCWGTMLYMGEDGYRRSAKQILSVAQRLRSVVEKSDLYFVYGDSLGSVVALGSNIINVYDLNDAMSKKGWHLSALQNPPAVHMAVTGLTHKAIDDLISDLINVGEDLRAKGSTASSSHGTKALYGVAGSVKTAGVANVLAEGFVDCLYKL